MSPGLTLLGVWSRSGPVAMAYCMQRIGLPRFGKPVRLSHIALTKVSPAPNSMPEDEFLTQFDIEVVESINSFTNRPSELLRMSAPAWRHRQ